MSNRLEQAIDKLSEEFSTLDLSFHPMAGGRQEDVTSFWPGAENENVMICVFKGRKMVEPFHRQDFFFLNYAYRQSYNALSAKFDNPITIHENECYIGQPYSGYAIRGESDKEIVIFGVLIRKEAFFREYLSTIAADSAMLRFFLEPQTNRFSDEFIHLTFSKDHPVRKLLELMAMEYAERREDTQSILKPMLLALFMHIARRYRLEHVQVEPPTLSGQIIQYMADHADAVTLKDIAAHFNYHPNYISALLPKETGRTFSELLLEKRMERAAILLKGTTLPIEEIAAMLGYSNSSNFYKAFKRYYGFSPREYWQEAN